MFYPVARIRILLLQNFRRRYSFETWNYATSPPAEALKSWNSRGGWTVFGIIEGVQATLNARKSMYIYVSYIQGLSRGIRFPLIKNGGESHYTCIILLYYYIYRENTFVGGGNRISGIRARCETHHIRNEGEDGSFNLKQVNDVKKNKSIHTYTYVVHTYYIYILYNTISTKSKGKNTVSS